MPVQKGKASGILAKLGNRVAQAHAKHKDDDTEYGNLGDLPAGINGGIAQVVDAKIDVTKEGKKHAGEYFLYIGAVVVSPKTFEGQQVEGMRTSIYCPLHDTPERNGERKTFEDHWGWMLNELRKLGIDTKTMKPDDLEATLEALRTSKPYIRFRTWKGQATPQYPNPRVNHEWGGLTEFTGEVDQIGAVDVEASGEAGDGEASNDDQQGEAEAAGDELAELGTAADEGNDEAQTTLSERATAAGLTEDQVGKAESWSALADLIRDAVAGGGDGSTDEAGGGWSVGDTCKYAPKDPKDKTGKKRLKKVECSILEINDAGDTVTLKNLDDPKQKYKGVSVNEIEPA